VTGSGDGAETGRGDGAVTGPGDGPPRLTHVDAAGAARMVDVAPKAVTGRVALAAGRLLVSPAVVALLRGAGVPKGDALGVARVAGIMATKRVPDLIPLCHPIALAGATVELTVRDEAVEIVARVRAADRTGVEMEALTAVAVAGLALHDMVKAVDPTATLTDVRLLAKTGGRSGDWHRPGEPASALASEPALARASEPPPEQAEPAPRPAAEPASGLPAGARARVITVSDRAAAGVYTDRSGPLAAGALAGFGFALDDVVVISDDRDAIVEAIRRAVADGVDVVVTTGGTGLAPRDVTPEATRDVLEREVPGLTEALRSAGAPAVPTAVLSRGLAGVTGRSMIVNLPGSRGGVRDGLAVLRPVIGHALRQLRGDNDHGHGSAGDELAAHGPDVHGPDAHGPDVHGPAAHGPDAHGPDAHGPDAHGPAAHRPDGPGHGASGRP